MFVVSTGKPKVDCNDDGGFASSDVTSPATLATCLNLDRHWKTFYYMFKYDQSFTSKQEGCRFDSQDFCVAVAFLAVLVGSVQV